MAKDYRYSIKPDGTRQYYKIGSDGRKRYGCLVACSNCGKKIFRHNNLLKKQSNFFCCRACIIQYNSKKIACNASCANCNKPLYRKKYLLKRYDKFFCSRKCQSLFRLMPSDKRTKVYFDEQNRIIQELEGTCSWCKKPFTYKSKRGKAYKRKYCSTQCKLEEEQVAFEKKWKAGKVTGYRNCKNFSLSNYLRRYLFRKFNSKCQRCGWAETNPSTQKIPLTVHHIDGDPSNNKEENLELLCPNCHSLTSTYCSLNKNSKRKK